MKKFKSFLVATVVVGLGLVSPALAQKAGTKGKTTPPTKLELMNKLLGTAKPGEDFVRVDDMLIPIAKVEKYRDSLVKASKKGGVRASSAFYFDATLWTGGRVPYVFDASLAPKQQAAFIESCREWEKWANLTFFPRTNEKNFLRVFTDPAVTDRSYSYIGMQGGSQDFMLANWADKSTSCHELGHALGMMHEQCRSDRDNYVTIDLSNIAAENQFAFALYPDSRNGGRYDFLSVMHYFETAFALDGSKPTIICKPGYTQYQHTMGTFTELSELDKKGMAALYGDPIPKTFTVSGVVTSLDADAGLPDATVTITDTTTGEVQTATTDGNGAYTFTVKAGTFTIAVSASGYTKAAQTLTVVRANRTADFVISLTTASYNVTGKVSEIVNGALVPLEGVQIAINGNAAALTDASGTYSTPKLTAGAYTITATKANYQIALASSSSVSLPARKIPTAPNGVVNFSAVSTVVNDSAPPVVTIDSPANGSTLYFTSGNGRSGIANITATDQTGVATLYLVLTQQKGNKVLYYSWGKKKWTNKLEDETLILARTMNGSKTVTWSQMLPKMEKGSYSLTVWGKDTLGNESEGDQDVTSLFTIAKQPKSIKKNSAGAS